MFISRILSLVAFSMFVAAACNKDEGYTQACCIFNQEDPSNGFNCVNRPTCQAPRSVKCCLDYFEGDIDAFDCEAINNLYVSAIPKGIVPSVTRFRLLRCAARNAYAGGVRKNSVKETGGSVRFCLGTFAVLEDNVVSKPAASESTVDRSSGMLSCRAALEECDECQLTWEPACQHRHWLRYKATKRGQASASASNVASSNTMGRRTPGGMFAAHLVAVEGEIRLF
ncbi:hypothetical protein BJ138DRAFT_1105298 [Hygrophoropsis aurantiaca]|uniref:Uncharacterized protein n=1 Tax=Hygrophoropsis aurantiaca TaxID=72124 RepID=A0ACB7ZZQ3_9AGAM|nr:hypothetical protein BJ138DRAFT_1105298 [Hygrophoropsis aurantiaca]